MIVVVGLGELGRAVVGGLCSAGQTVHGVDPAKDARDRAVAESPIVVSPNLDDIAWIEVRAVFVVVLTTMQALSVLGEVHLRAACRASEDQVPVFVMTTMSPDGARELGGVPGEYLRVLEAPISGGTAGARRGQLTVMVGGPATPVDVGLLTTTVASEVVQFPAYGDATLAKLLNNAVMAAQVALVADALQLAQDLGMSVPQIYGILTTCSGRSLAAKNFFTVRPPMLAKDVRLLRESFPEVDRAGHLGQAIADVESLESTVQRARATHAEGRTEG